MFFTFTERSKEKQSLASISFFAHLQIRYAARTLAYSLLDALPANEQQALVSQWADFLPANPVAPASGSAETNQLTSNGSTASLNGLDATPKHIGSVKKVESPAALACCEKAELLGWAHDLEAGVFDTFAFGPKRLLPGSAAFRYRAVESVLVQPSTLPMVCLSVQPLAFAFLRPLLFGE